MCTYCPQVVTAQNTSTLIHWLLQTGPIIVGVRLQLSLELSNEPKRVYVNSFFEDQSIVSSNNRQLLQKSLSSNSVFVFSCTERTHPFLSGYVRVILPNDQEPHGAVGSMMTTISPTVKFLRDFVPEAVEDIPLSTFSKTDQTDIGLVAIFV